MHQLGIPLQRLHQNEFGYLALFPQKVKFFKHKKVSDVACGEAHTLVLDAVGQVYAFGWAEDGQLGLPSNELQQNIIGYGVKQVTALATVRVKKVCAGALFSACLSDEGQVYVWGNGQQGQLGLGREVLYEDFPKPVVRQVVNSVCGECHVLCLTTAGTVLGWGLGIAGQVSGGFQEGCPIACFKPQPIGTVESCATLE